MINRETEPIIDGNRLKANFLEALDRREDRMLSAIAKVRDMPKAKRIKHDDAWK